MTSLRLGPWAWLTLAVGGCVSDSVPTTDGGTDGTVGDASDCSIIYVASSGGADTNDGCVKTNPKKTVVSGVRSAKDHAAKEVQICEGTYDENHLVVDFAVSLKGGYDCNTWQRGPDATLTDNNRTTIRNGAYSATTPTTVEVNGNAITRVNVLEGLTIEGGDAADATGSKVTAGTTALLLTAGSPTLRRLKVIGGAAADGGTRAVMVSDGDPEIAFCSFDGGAGKALATHGSFALEINGGGKPSIHDNLIVGGSGSTQATGYTGSIGLAIFTAATVGDPIERNDIRGGTGVVAGGTYTRASLAIAIAKTPFVDFRSNAIDGGNGRYASAPGYASRGTEAITAVGPNVRVRLAGNRIYAGKLGASPGLPTSGGSVAMTLQSVDTELVNNFIASGVASPVGMTVAINSDSQLVAIHNTFVGGFDAATGSRIITLANGRSSVLQNNLFVQRGSAAVEGAIVLATCASQGPIAIMENNLFAYSSGSLLSYIGTALTPDCSSVAPIGSVDAMETELKKAPTLPVRVSGNRRITPPVCGGSEPGCIPAPPCGGDAGATACARDLFASWKTDGISDLLDGGLPLKSGTYCIAMGGGLDVRNAMTLALTTDAGADAGVLSLPGVSTDAFGAPRTPDGGKGISLGAHELESLTCVP